MGWEEAAWKWQTIYTLFVAPVGMYLSEVRRHQIEIFLFFRFRRSVALACEIFESGPLHLGGSCKGFRLFHVSMMKLK